MIRWPAVCTAAISLLLLPGCSRVTDRGSAVEQHQPEPTFVEFDVQPLKSTDGAQLWIATYTSEAKMAKFRIDLGPTEVVPGKNAGDPALRSGEGAILPEPGSDSSVLLAQLQKALRAKATPTAPATKTSIPFTYTYVGENLSKAQDGAFKPDPPGHWTELRLIFGDGDHASQMFLNINATAKKGRFSMKDPVYGDLATAELAKVL